MLARLTTSNAVDLRRSKHTALCCMWRALVLFAYHAVDFSHTQQTDIHTHIGRAVSTAVTCMTFNRCFFFHSFLVSLVWIVWLDYAYVRTLYVQIYVVERFPIDTIVWTMWFARWKRVVDFIWFFFRVSFMLYISYLPLLSKRIEGNEMRSFGGCIKWHITVTHLTTRQT